MIKHIARIEFDNQVYVFVAAGRKIHVIKAYIDDITTPTRLNRQLFRQKSLLVPQCSDTRDGHWPRARWNQLLNDRMRIFRSTVEFYAWDEVQSKLDNASL